MLRGVTVATLTIPPSLPCRPTLRRHDFALEFLNTRSQ
jgi:hypothetical protein